MLIPPKYFLTSKITSLLSEIESSRAIVESLEIPIEVEQNIRRKSTLNSSLFSARIEGNSALPSDFHLLPSSDIKKIEVNNILRSINWIRERTKRDVTVKDILLLHSYSMKNIEFEELGKFRTKHEGIFSSSGVVVYHAPPPSLILKLVERLLGYINSDKEKLTPIKALIAHYIFEKIHPFTDGSGRVGRLLLLLTLSKDGYDFKGILPFEEQIDKRRETYYRMLEEPERDITMYLEFMLEVLAEASKKAKQEILSKKKINKYDELLPRRSEIVMIIRDHKLINIDFLKRRFDKINERTLRYDLKKLIDGGYVTKLGTTKGVYYKLNEN